MDRDELPEIVIGTEGTLAVANNLLSTFAPFIEYAGPREILAMEVVDTGGVANDIAFIEYNTPGFKKAINRGDGTFTPFTALSEFATSPMVEVDIDQDGDLDFYMGSATLFLNDGTGGFDDEVDLSGIGTAMDLAAGDIDEDGDIDLLTAGGGNQFGSVIIAENLGDLNFLEFSQQVSFPSAANSISVSDLDNDSDLDLVTSNPFTDTVTVNINLGLGVFAPFVTYDVGDDPQEVRVGDIDGDFLVDIVVANFGSNDISILYNLGNGTFSFPTSIAVGAEPSSLDIADLDGDSDLDLVVANGDADSITVLLNQQRDGTFAATEIAVGILPIDVAIGDLNGDGFPDIAVANRVSWDISVLVNKGDGQFDQAHRIAAGEQISRVILGDFDNDSDLDYLANNDTFEYNRRRTFIWPNQQLRLGDLNGDGVFDLLDVAPFVDAIISGRYSAEADVNMDGAVDLLDVAAFVDLLTS